MQSFPEKITAIERELVELQDEPDSPALQARKASLLRSLDWYRSRTRSISVIGASVGDEISTAEAH